MTEKKEKDKGVSLGSELRKVQSIPLDRLSIQLGVEPETARLIQNLIRDFLSEHGEEAENSDNNPERPIKNFTHLFFYKSGCTCKWCRLKRKQRRQKKSVISERLLPLNLLKSGFPASFPVAA